MKVERLWGEASAAFEADQIASSLPTYPERAEQLGKKFNFAEVGLTNQNGVQLWIATRGSVDNLKIVVAQGNDNELTVRVDGTTKDARRALADLWRYLAGDGAEIEAEATIVEKTTAIVRLERRFAELFPQAATIAKAITEHGSALTRGVSPMFRFSAEFPFSVGAQSLPRVVTFEPRATAGGDGRTFFTQSPLSTDVHLKLVRELAGEVD